MAHVVEESIGGRQKRQRVSRACDSCRRKKIKCDGVRPTCTNCGNSKQPCVYTVPERKPKRIRKKASNIVALESRLDKIESLLEKIIPENTKRKRSNVDPEEDYDSYDAEPDVEGEADEEEDLDSASDPDIILEVDNLGRSMDRSNPHDSEWMDRAANDEEDIPGTGEAMMVPLQSSAGMPSRNSDLISISIARGNTQIFTSRTMLTLFTKTGVQWIIDKTGHDEIAGKISTVVRHIQGIYEQRSRYLIDLPLQPHPLDRNLVEFSRDSFRRGPEPWKLIISPDDLDSLVEAEYNESMVPNGFSELLIINAVMALCSPMAAIGLQNRRKTGSFFKNTPGGQKIDDSDANFTSDICGGYYCNPNLDSSFKKYAANCIYYSVRVGMLKPNINSVRGLILTMMAFQCADLIELNLQLISQAGRLAVDLGLNRAEPTQGLSEEEAESRRALFLGFYMLDRDLSLRLNRCPIILDFDITAKLPAAVLQNEGSPLLLMAKLYKIAGKIYPLLYSAKASKKKPTDLVRSICDLDKELMAWREEVPADWRPGVDMEYFRKVQTQSGNVSEEWLDLLMKMYLHFVFYELMTTIHKITAYHPSWVYATIADENSSSGSTGSNMTPTSTHTQPSPEGSTVNNANMRQATIGSKYPRLFSSLEICVSAARSTIELVSMSHALAKSFFWGALFFSTTSFTTLYIRSVAKPLDPSTRYDLTLMKRLIEGFRTPNVSLTAEEFSTSQLICQFWECLWDTADSYIEEQEANKKQQSRKSSKLNGNKRSMTSSPTAATAASNLSRKGNSNYGMDDSKSSITTSSRSSDNINTTEPPQSNGSTTLNDSQVEHPAIYDNPFLSYMPEVNEPDQCYDYLPDDPMAQSLYSLSSQFYSWDANGVDLDF